MPRGSLRVLLEKVGLEKLAYFIVRETLQIEALQSKTPTLVDLRHKEPLEISDEDTYDGEIAPENASL